MARARERERARQQREVCAEPASIRYWLIPDSEVERLFEDDTITFQHGPDSRWFRAEPRQTDAFSSLRLAKQDFVKALATQLAGE